MNKVILAVLWVPFLALPGSLDARDWSLDLGAGWAVPLSPEGTDSFVSEHHQSVPSSFLRFQRHLGQWAMGVATSHFRFPRMDSSGAVDMRILAVSGIWEYPADDRSTDHFYAGMQLGWCGVAADAPQIGRLWDAPSLNLAFGYERPIWRDYAILAETGSWMLGAPSGFDPLVFGYLRLLFRSSF